MSRSTRKRRIVILGGGMAAVAAAFELTSDPGWKSRYDVTLYQMGFRLGGKGASGRNQRQNMRIEEHGLHVWGGHYDNAFNVIRRCYAELARSPTAPLATWDQAFKKRSFFTLEEHIADHWQSWSFCMPETDAAPGGEPAPLKLIDVVNKAIRALKHSIEGARTWKDERDYMPGKGRGAGDARREQETLDSAIKRLLRAALAALASPSGDASGRGAGSPLQKALDEIQNLLRRWLFRRIEANDEARRRFILADLVLAHLRGVLLDGVLSRGWSALDDVDWADWLRTHGASSITLQSPLVHGMYDLYFAYPGGDTSNPRIAASSVVYTTLRFLFGHKGAPFWEMQGGMGDVVFAPLYEVLRRRGVRFEFFHAATNLGLSPDRRSIGSIRLVRQARLTGAEYAPLIDVNGLPCWPSEPLYEQLEGGAEIERAQIDFESPWSAWPHREAITLRSGVDFDVVVLGIPLGALPAICPELIEASDRWRAMIQNLPTVQTQAMQLWLKSDTKSLGWTAPRTILCAYAQPFNTWADMSHTLEFEAWPEGSVGSVAYFCGPMREVAPDEDPGSPFTDRGFPSRAKEEVRRAAVGWLKEYPGHLFRAARPAGSMGLRWEELVGPEALAGEARFDAHYHRANESPSDRYVLSLPGTNKYRLDADASGFENLYVVGDWVKNPYNLGTIEAATITGLTAARAIRGAATKIADEG